MTRAPKAAILFFIVAVILAAFLRFFRLDQIPPGVTFDEAGHALDALDILNGEPMLISPRLRQTPAGYMQMLAIAFQLFGANILVQRSLTAVCGLLLLPVNFLVVREIFRSRPDHNAGQLALFSTLLMATSFWAVLSSRIGYEYIVAPIFALAAA